MNRNAYQQVTFIPFDPVRKRTEAEVEFEGRRFQAIKGAAQVLIEMAGLDEGRARGLNEAVDRLAAKGYRTLAVGRRQGSEAPLELIGLIPRSTIPRVRIPRQ